jgi:hypothetical protein
MDYKAILKGLTAVRVREFKFENQTFYAKDLTISEGDECYSHLSTFLSENGKVKTDVNSVGEFGKYRNKFIAYSLCDSEGNAIFTVEEIEKLDYQKIQSLFTALAEAANGRSETI